MGGGEKYCQGAAEGEEERGGLLYWEGKEKRQGGWCKWDKSVPRQLAQLCRYAIYQVSMKYTISINLELLKNALDSLMGLLLKECITIKYHSLAGSYHWIMSFNI